LSRLSPAYPFFTFISLSYILQNEPHFRKELFKSRHYYTHLHQYIP
jgi:hypothetical protein